MKIKKIIFKKLFIMLITTLVLFSSSIVIAKNHKQNLINKDEETPNISNKGYGVFPPTGWTIVDHSGTGTWTCGVYGNHDCEPPGTGKNYAECWQYSGETFDSSLFTPCFDFTGFSEVTLIFDRNFQGYLGNGQAAVNTYSGGILPSNFEEQLFYFNTNDPPSGVADTTNFLTVSSYSNPAEVYIEFWYTDDNIGNGKGFCIDDVEIPEISFHEGFEGCSDNEQPEDPDITGSSVAVAGKPYECLISSIDPESCKIKIRVKWGDENDSGWIGPVPSGEKVPFNHTYVKPGIYFIKAKAKDEQGAESGETIKLVLVIKNKASNMPDLFKLSPIFYTLFILKCLLVSML